MADLTLTAGLLAGEDVDETALETEIAAADMKEESFFSPAHDHGLPLLDAIDALTGGDKGDPHSVSSRVRAVLGRAEEIVQNTDERDLLIARLKHRMEEDGLPEPTDDELGRIAKLMHAVHGIEVDVQQPKWEPPRAVLDVDPNALHTADTGPVIGPAKVPPPHVQRRLVRKMRDRDRDRSDTPTRGDAQRAQKAQKAQGARGGANPSKPSGAPPPPVNQQEDPPPPATSTSTGTGSGGGGGPNTAHAEVHIHWPPQMMMPIPPSPPAPNAPALDAEAMRRVFAEGQAHLLDETRRMVDGVRQANERTMDDVLEAMEKLRDKPVKKPFWNIGFSWAKALVAILLLLGILGITWWTFQPAEHTRNVTTKLDSRSPSSP